MQTPPTGLDLLVRELGKVPLTNGGFRKLTEVSVNERQKPLIFKTFTERISRFWKKKINGWKQKRNGFIFKKRWILHI